MKNMTSANTSFKDVSFPPLYNMYPTLNSFLPTSYVRVSLCVFDQNTVVVSLRPPRKKPKRPRPPSDDDEDDATARAAADAARKAAQEALAAAVAARSISLLEEAIPLAAAAGVDKDEVAAAQKLLEQLCQEAEANLHKPRPATAEVVDVPTHLSAEGTAAAELTALLVTCRLVHFQRPLCANGHDTVAKVQKCTCPASPSIYFFSFTTESMKYRLCVRLLDCHSCPLDNVFSPFNSRLKL